MQQKTNTVESGIEDIKETIDPEIKKQFDEFLSYTKKDQGSSKQPSTFQSFKKILAERTFYFSPIQTRKINRLLSYTDTKGDIYKIQNVRNYSATENLGFGIFFLSSLFFPKKITTKFILGLSCIYIKHIMLDNIISFQILNGYLRTKALDETCQEARNVVEFYGKKILQNEMARDSPSLSFYAQKMLYNLLEQIEQTTQDYFLFQSKEYIL